MVGGTTRNKIVREKVKEFFPEDVKMNVTIDPDTVVAYGATVYAAKLSVQGEDAQDEGVDQIVLNDVTPLTIGVLKNVEVP